MRGSDLIRSGQSATGAIGTALAGEVTAARLRVPGSPLGFRGARGKTVGGFCKDGDKLEISDDHGVPVLMPK